MEEGSLYAKDLQIDGVLAAEHASIEHELTVNGTMNIETLWIDDPYSLTGRENIQGEGYEIICRFHPETVEEFYQVLNFTATLGDEYLRCVVALWDDQFVIDRDLTIPAYAYVSFDSSFSNTFILASGCTMTVNRKVYFPDSQFFGVLVNNGSIDFTNRTALFGNDSCYRGTGDISIWGPMASILDTYRDYYKDVIVGLDYSKFAIRFDYDDELIDDTTARRYFEATHITVR